MVIGGGGGGGHGAGAGAGNKINSGKFIHTYLK